MADVRETVPLSRVPRATSPAVAPSLRLTVVEGPAAGATLVLGRSQVVVGRSQDADFPIPEPSLSQFHAELSPRPSGILVRDLGSRNGTFVGPVRLERAEVPSGTLLSLGAVVLRLDHDLAFQTPRATATSFGGLLGQSAAMRELYARLELLSEQGRRNILLQGETGTGKDLCARALHGAGPRRGGPFVVLDCTRIPATLAESALFGHRRGAFTGAQDQKGFFEAASGGVLFMDEIGELPLSLQPLLLRVLEERRITPVGRTDAIAVDVQVIAASWRDLRKMVNEGRFREDLYHRIHGAFLHVPSLSERPDDIPLLVHHFLREEQKDGQALQAAPEVLAELCGRVYRGNVRELKHTVERLAMVARGPVITLDDVTFERMLSAARQEEAPAVAASASVGRVATAPAAPVGEPADYKSARRTCLDEFERAYLEQLLERCDGNLSKAARLAGLLRHSLRDLLRKHGLYRAKTAEDEE